MTGKIFNVQRFSLHDGPGIRTTVFMKGCPLRCLWCHNPEGLSAELQLQFFSDKCIGCGVCRNACHSAWMENSRIDFTKCTLCEKCVTSCPTSARTVCGREITVDDLIREVMADSAFYSEKGGITFSGGEPLLQADFIAEAAKEIKNHGYSVAVDTCGAVEWISFEKVLPYTDLFLYDVKTYSSDIHKAATGVNNTVIKENLKLLNDTGKEIWLRTPVIPGVNADEDEMVKIAEFVSAFSSVSRVTLMPYHSLGKNKYETLGYEYKYDASLSVSEEEMAQYTKIFVDRNITVK